MGGEASSIWGIEREEGQVMNEETTSGKKKQNVTGENGREKLCGRGELPLNNSTPHPDWSW